MKIEPQRDKHDPQEKTTLEIYLIILELIEIGMKCWKFGNGIEIAKGMKIVYKGKCWKMPKCSPKSQKRKLLNEIHSNPPKPPSYVNRKSKVSERVLLSPLTLLPPFTIGNVSLFVLLMGPTQKQV